MPDPTNKPLMEAAADLLDAAGDLVRAASNAPASPAATVVPTRASLDSPAWYDLHHPDGNAGVHALGEAYFDLHVPAVKGADGKLTWDPSRGATWMDFARIGRRMFDAPEIFDASNAFRSAPFESLRLLQRMVARYDVESPDAPVPADFPWPTNEALFGQLNLAWTRRQAIAAYLSFFNVDPKTGHPADRKDFGATAGTALSLTHGQCVELRHILVTQEDIRLVAPYDIADTLAW